MINFNAALANEKLAVIEIIDRCTLIIDGDADGHLEREERALVESRRIAWSNYLARLNDVGEPPSLTVYFDDKRI